MFECQKDAINRLGAFHMAIGLFLGSICDPVGGSGLKNVLESIYASKAIEHRPRSSQERLLQELLLD